MATALTLSLVLHILTGFTALITGFLSMLNRKGSKAHRLTGKLFFASMTGVFITAIFIAVAKNLAFLFMVGFFSYYLACSGYRVLYAKQAHRQRPQFMDWLISGTGMLAGLALVLFSLHWFTNRGAWGAVPLVFGVFSFLNGFMDLRRFYKAPQSKQQYIIIHASRMGGSFAATLTAFIVVNLSLGELGWILWIAPGVLTGIWISRTTRNFLQPKRSKVKKEMVVQ
jgi:uncharacterized membrane protein